MSGPAAAPDDQWCDLQRHLLAIAKARDPYLNQAHHYFTRAYIRQAFSQHGTVTCHSFQHHGQTHENLILDLEHPHVTDQPPIILGAHYDAFPGSPGADDNATGLAVLLHLAQHFARSPSHSPLRLIAFDLEEYGCLGSQAYAALLRQQQQPIKLMLSLEMLGYASNAPHSQTYPPGLAPFYPHHGNFIAQIGNLKAIPIMQRIHRGFRDIALPCQWLPVPFKGTILPDTRRSDHASFWDQNYNAIMLTDTANMRNPNYHTRQDTVDTLNLDFLNQVCRGLKAILHIL